MNKIIRAINAMVSNPDKIVKVMTAFADRNEYFFNYDNKYNWSIQSRNKIYYLYFYPGKLTLEVLAASAPEEFDINEVEMITYSTDIYSTVEARDSFIELYQIVKEKAYGLDKVLDDIIKGEGNMPF